MSLTLDFLQEVKIGADMLGIAPTTLCQRAVKNGKLIRRLEAGGEVSLGTVEAIRAYIDANRPKAEEAAE